VDGFGTLAMARHREGRTRPRRVVGGLQQWPRRWRPVGQGPDARAAKAAEAAGAVADVLESPVGPDAGRAAEFAQISQPPIAMSKIGHSKMPTRARRRTLSSRWRTGVVDGRPR
jgi:hypothetical protein